MLTASFLFVFFILLSAFTFIVVVDAASLIRVGVLGDFGRATVPQEYRRWYTHTGELAVANMIKFEYPFFNAEKGGALDAIITLGDDNYEIGNWSTIDANIGDFYADWIYPFNGNSTRSPTAPKYNRFFETIGNHNYYYSEEAYESRNCTSCPEPYLDYYRNVLPPNGTSAPESANGRYYDFVRGDVHFFALNSNRQEPDGRLANGRQAMWLKNALAKSTSNHKVVYLHHLCYSNDDNDGPNPDLCWPFQEWGASVVIAGHAHAYQKFNVDGFYWLGNGLGGTFMYASIPPENFSPGTQVWYNATWGAQLLEADECSLNISFISIDRGFVDTVRIPPVILPAAGCSYVNGGGGGSNNNNNNGGNTDSSAQNASKNDMGAGIGIGVGVTLAAFLLGYLIMNHVQKQRGGGTTRATAGTSAVESSSSSLSRAVQYTTVAE